MLESAWIKETRKHSAFMATRWRISGHVLQPRGSSSNIASVDEKTLGNTIKDTFSQKKILSGRTTLVLSAAQEKEELVGTSQESSSWFVSKISSQRDTVPLAQQMPRSSPGECPHKSASLPWDWFVLGWISNGPQSARENYHSFQQSITSQPSTGWWWADQTPKRTPASSQENLDWRVSKGQCQARDEVVPALWAVNPVTFPEALNP